MDTFLKAFDNAMGLFYPRICPVCGERLSFHIMREELIHPSCRAKLVPVCGRICRKCGKPLAEKEAQLCRDCQNTDRSFISGRSLWIYDAYSSKAIFLYKYGKKREAARFFAEALAAEYGGWIRDISPDVIVPVPVSRERLKQRGFNQAQLIAQELGEQIGIPCLTNVLFRVRKTLPQKELTHAQRQHNLEQAFRADNSSLAGVEKILLFDDIYTTGATAEYCTRALLDAGAGKVWMLSLCIGTLHRA